MDEETYLYNGKEYTRTQMELKYGDKVDQAIKKFGYEPKGKKQKEKLNTVNEYKRNGKSYSREQLELKYGKRTEEAIKKFGFEESTPIQEVNATMGAKPVKKKENAESLLPKDVSESNGSGKEKPISSDIPEDKVSVSEDLWNQLRSGASTSLAGVAGVKNFLNKSIASVMMDDNDKKFINSLDPKIREVAINSIFGGTPMDQSLGSASIEAQNKLTEYSKKYEERTLKFEGNIVDDISKGNISQAAYRTLQGTVSSIPSMIMAIAPGGLAVIGAGTASQKQEQLESEGEGIGIKTVLNATINGVAEAFFEKYTAKIGKGVLKSFSGGKEAAAKEFSESIVKTILKDAGMEGGSEAATQIVQDLSDKLVQGKDISVMQIIKNTVDAGIIGGAMGGAMSSPKAINGYIASKTIKKETKQLIDTKTAQAVSIEDQASLPEVPEGLKHVLNEKAAKIRKEVEVLTNKEVDRAASLKPEEVKSIFEVDDKMKKIAETSAELINNKDISDDVKKSVLDDNMKEYESLKSQKEELSKSEFEKLPAEDKKQFIDKATELSPDENKNSEIAKKNIQDRAEELYQESKTNPEKSIDNKERVSEIQSILADDANSKQENGQGNLIPEARQELQDELKNLTEKQNPESLEEQKPKEFAKPVEVQHQKGTFTVQSDETGNQKVFKKDGTEVQKYTTRKLKDGKEKRVKNAQYSMIVAKANNELTDNQINEERKRLFDKAFDQSTPSTPAEIVNTALASGRKVSRESIKKEVGENPKHYTWATGINKEESLPSIEKLAEDLASENSELGYEDYDYRNAIIDALSQYESIEDVRDEIIKNHNKINEDAERQQMEAAMSRLSPEEIATLEAETFDESIDKMSDSKKFKLYEHEYEKQIESLSEAERNEYYDTYIETEPQRVQPEIQSNAERSKERERQRGTKQSPELQEADRQIAEAQEKVKSAEAALKNKAKVLDQSIVEDQKDVFGDRKSQQENKILDERVDIKERNKATEQERQAVEDAKQELQKLRNKKRELLASGETTSEMDFDSTISKESKKVDISKSAKLNDIVDALDKFDKDLQAWGKENLGIGLPVVVAQAAVKAMKVAAITAKTTGDVISAGINAIYATKWYKNLSQENSDFINEDSLSTLIVESVKNANKETQKLQKEREDFKTYMKELKSDFKEYLGFQEENKKAIRDKLKEFKNKNLISNRTFDAIINKLNQASTQNNFNKLSEYIDKAIAEADNKQYNKVIKDILDKIKLSKYTKSRASGIKKSTITNDQRTVLKTIKDALKQDNADNLTQQRNDLVDQAISDPSLIDDLAPQIEGLNIAIEALSGLPGAKSALGKIKEQIRESRSDLKEVLKAKSENYKANTEGTIKSILGGKKKPDIFNAKKQKENKRGVIKRTLDGISGFMDAQEGLRMLFDKIDRGARKDGAFSSFMDSLYIKIADSRTNKDNLNQSSTKLIQDKLFKIYGGKNKARKALNNNSKSNSLGIFTLNTGEKINLELSQNQAYQLYNMTKNAEANKTFAANGWTQEMLTAIEGYLTPETKQWADWQTDEFYPKMHDDVNKVYNKMNYMDLGRPENYAPIRRSKIKRTLVEDVGAFHNQSVNAEYGSLGSRTNNNTMFDISADGDAVLMNYIAGMNHYISFAESIKELGSVFGNPEVRELIKLENSNETLKVIDGFLLDIANENTKISEAFGVLNKIRGWHTTSSLAISPLITLKQLISAPAYIADIGTRNFIKNTAEFILNPVKYAKTLKRVFNDSGYLKDRYKNGFTRDMAVALKRDYKQSLAGKSTFLDKLMFNVKIGDAGGIAMGMGAYLHYYNKFKKTMPENVAHQKAVREFEESTKLSQQSTNTEDMSSFQRGGHFAKIFTMYLTSPIAYMRHERKGVRDIFRGAKEGDAKRIKDGARRFVIYHAVLPVIFQYVANGLPGILASWNDDDEKDLKRAALLGNINGVFIAGKAFNYMADIVTGKPWARKGTNSYTPVFDNINDLSYSVAKLMKEYNDNPDKLEEDLIKELSTKTAIDLSDMVGLPASRLQKTYKSVTKAAGGWDNMSDKEKTATVLGYSNYLVKKMKSDADKNKKPNSPKDVIY